MNRPVWLGIRGDLANGDDVWYQYVDDPDLLWPDVKTVGAIYATFNEIVAVANDWEKCGMKFSIHFGDKMYETEEENVPSL